MDGQTTLVGVMGWPIAHSLSPAMHNAAFQALGMNWAYVPVPVRPGAVGAAVAGLRALGFRGCNVTVPHKEAVIETFTSFVSTRMASARVCRRLRSDSHALSRLFRSPICYLSNVFNLLVGYPSNCWA